MSKPSDTCIEQTPFYLADIKPQFQFNFGMALPHSPFPWYPNSNTSGATPCFSHPNYSSTCTSSGTKNLTSVKSELKPPCLTEITSSLGKTVNCMPTSSANASPEEHVDVVTILPQKYDSSESVTESGISNQSVNKPSADYSSHFDLGNKIQPIKIGTILPKRSELTGSKLSTIICLKYL